MEKISAQTVQELQESVDAIYRLAADVERVIDTLDDDGVYRYEVIKELRQAGEPITVTSGRLAKIRGLVK